MMSTQTERFLRASSVLERRLNRKSGTELIQGHIPSRHPPKWQVKKGDMIFLTNPLRRQTTSLGCSPVWPPGQGTWSLYKGYSGQPSSECWGSGSLEEHWVKLIKPDRFSEPPGLFALCAWGRGQGGPGGGPWFSEEWPAVSWLVLWGNNGRAQAGSQKLKLL